MKHLIRNLLPAYLFCLYHDVQEPRFAHTNLIARRNKLSEMILEVEADYTEPIKFVNHYF